MATTRAEAYLATFDISSAPGCLPYPDPLTELPKKFRPWDEIGRELPKILAAKALRQEIKKLPVIEVVPEEEAERRLALVRLSFIAHGLVWENWENNPAKMLVRQIAIPLCNVANSLGLKPLLSYAPYALYNWRHIDPAGPIELGNIALIQNFLGGLDEEWFVLSHVVIESQAGLAEASVPLLQDHVRKNYPASACVSLAMVCLALEKMNKTLQRIPEYCDPYIYYRRVRPYLHGWKNHKALPEGLIYEGVSEYGGAPQQFRGETGAQSLIVPLLDALLGIAHKDDPMRPYLLEMREYMPPKHQRFLEITESGPSVREFVKTHKNQYPDLREIYNRCVKLVWDFRSTHLRYAALYIQRQAQLSSSNPTEQGTGGTPFMPYLDKHRVETIDHLLI